MPRDLFGDVTHPSISVGNRKWYTVPLSLAAHVSVIVAVVFVSLVAQEYMPIPREMITYIGGIKPPDPPAIPVKRIDTKPAADPNAAPTRAPEGIAPETGLENRPNYDLGPGIDVGTVPAGGEPIVGDVLVAPPPPPKPQEPVRVGDRIRTPTKIRDAHPIYPAIAQAARVEGTVILEAILDETGHVRNLRVLRSHPMLEQAAVDAVRQWEYTPSLLNGVPVPVIMTVTVTFTLNR